MVPTTSYLSKKLAYPENFEDHKFVYIVKRIKVDDFLKVILDIVKASYYRIFSSEFVEMSC